MKDLSSAVQAESRSQRLLPGAYGNQESEVGFADNR